MSSPSDRKRIRKHIGETFGCEGHDHNLVHALSWWRYDQYIAKADLQADLQGFWRDLKAQEKHTLERLKKLLMHVQRGCF